MTAASLAWLTILGIANALAADPAGESKVHPFAPSLAQLSEEEEARIDRVIDRFMLYDIGKLRGEEGKSALRDFDKLSADAIPALIRGLNRAARIEHSCPATVIAKKLHRMLMGSQDTDLLEFARDEIGSGVGRSRHQAIIQDLRVACMIRKNGLLRAGIGPIKPIRTLTTPELAAAAGKEQGPRLKEALAVLEQRKGPEVLQGLARATANPDKEVQQLARELLDRHLYRQPVEAVKKGLKHENPEVRRSAVRLVAARAPALAGDLVDMLADMDAEVRKLAHDTLVIFNKGVDLGPAADSSQVEIGKSQEKWRNWWEIQRNP